MEDQYIYLLYKEGSNTIVKIGSTRNPLERLAVYKTWHFSEDGEELQYYKLYSINANCYDVDEHLKNDTSRGFARYRELGLMACGTEFYQLPQEDVALLEEWFTRRNIEFKDCNIDELTRASECRASLLDEFTRESLRDPINIQLRGYQLIVYDRLINYLRHNKKAVLDIFCGGGKTVLYQKYVLDNYATYSSIVLVVPKLSLLDDMAKRFDSLCSLLHLNIIQIGSHRDGTTDLKNIEGALGNSSRHFIISTYKSASLLLEPLREQTDVLFIFDECHYCCSPESILQTLKPIEENIKHMIFATASPKYSQIGQQSIGMNNIEYFGEFICNIPMARLIRECFLCEYTIIVEQGSQMLNGAKNYYNTALNILKKYIETNAIKKILLYTNSINNIGTIYDSMKSDAFFSQFALFRAHSGLTNSEILRQKRNYIESAGIAIMVNCQLFTEGINIPELDAVVFCDPKNSEAEIIQCFGRAMRRDPNNLNKVAKIFIPICEEDIGSKFAKLFKIIKIISAHDPKLRDEIKSLSRRHDAKTRDKPTRPILNICISDANYKILDLRRSKLCIESMGDAILYILRDYIPRTTAKIWQEFTDREIYESNGKTPKASCSSQCGILFQQGKLQRTGQPYKYYIERVCRLTPAEFIQELLNKNIETEEGYRIEYEPYANPNFPFNPADRYSGFEWKHLLLKKYYTLEECVARLAELESSVLELGLITDLEKNNYLSDIDPKIPKNLRIFYRKKLYTLNNAIFKELRR